MHAHPLTRSLLRSAWLLVPAALLSACGGHKEVAKATPPPVTDKIVEIQPTERDGRGAYRFHMSNGEKRMSADEFDAWMKARGARVATGKPKPNGAAQPAAATPPATPPKKD